MMMEGSISRRKSPATGKGPTRNSEAQGRYSEMNERDQPVARQWHSVAKAARMQRNPHATWPARGVC